MVVDIKGGRVVPTDGNSKLNLFGCFLDMFFAFEVYAAMEDFSEVAPGVRDSTSGPETIRRGRSRGKCVTLPIVTVRFGRGFEVVRREVALCSVLGLDSSARSRFIRSPLPELS